MAVATCSPCEASARTRRLGTIPFNHTTSRVRPVWASAAFDTAFVRREAASAASLVTAEADHAGAGDQPTSSGTDADEPADASDHGPSAAEELAVLQAAFDLQLSKSTRRFS